jgi:Xaa-Pro aminopeptidase
MQILYTGFNPTNMLAPSPFSLQEYNARTARTAKALQELGVDLLIAFANKVMPGFVRYLSGYETRHGIHDWSALLFEPEFGRSALLTNVSWEPVAEMTWVPDVRLTSGPKAGGVMASWTSAKVSTIGLAGYNAFPTPIYRALAEAFSGARILDVSHVLLEVRQTKSSTEIQVLRKCAEITDAGAHAFLSAAQEGQSERDILAEVESALRRAGSDETSFTTQVGSGLNTSCICPYATDRRLSQGDLVLLDCGATFWGYRGDISRVAIVGKPSARQELLLNVTAEMYQCMLEALRPGVTAAEIATIGMDIARSYGLEDCLYRSPSHDVGFMGHGMGCSYSEPPELNPGDRTLLKENMLMVVEPILFEEGVGGVKLEDAVVITPHGAERLSACPLRTW